MSVRIEEALYTLWHMPQSVAEDKWYTSEVSQVIDGNLASVKNPACFSINPPTWWDVIVDDVADIVPGDDNGRVRKERKSIAARPR